MRECILSAQVYRCVWTSFSRWCVILLFVFMLWRSKIVVLTCIILFIPEYDAWQKGSKASYFFLSSFLQYYWLPFVYHHKLIHGQLSMSKERRCAQEHSHCFKSFDALWTSFVFAVMICTTRRASSILLVNSRFVLCSISRGWCHFTHSSRKVQGHSTNSIVHHPLFVRQTL